MHLLKKILNFYVFSNIHVAVAGFCITEITLVKFGITNRYSALFVLFSIIASYNFIRYYEIKSDSLNWFKNWFFNHRKSLVILSVLSLILSTYLVFFTNFNKQSLVLLFPFFFITFFYVVPLLKKGEIEFSFRNFPSIKIFSIAVAWAGVSVLFPIFEAGIEFTHNIYIEFIQRILFVIAITIPFDIRDMYEDKKSLKTIPQVFGLQKTKIIGVVVLMLFVLLELLKQPVVTKNIIVTLLISVISTWFILKSSPKKSRYFTAFWVEAAPIFWLILLVLLKK